MNIRTERILLFRQLSTLLDAGVPIIQAFSILHASQKKPLFRKILQNIKNDLQKGKSLTMALRNDTLYFDAFCCHLILAGEQTGKLTLMLTRIADYQEKQLTLIQKIQHALIYPGIVMSCAILLTLSMLIFIVPRFAELFQDYHQALPLPTQIIIFLSSGLRHWGGLYFLLLILFCLSVYYHAGYFKKLFLSLPYIHSLRQKIFFIHFARTLSIQFAAGMPITDILKTMTTFTHHPPHRKALHTLQTEIAIGQNLHRAMSKTRLFPTLMLQMVKVGEESGTLDQMFNKTADFYVAEVDASINKFSHLLEPLIIIALGILIGSMVVAMYLPIFTLGTFV